MSNPISRPEPQSLSGSPGSSRHKRGAAEVIAEEVRLQIVRGDLRSGSRLPTERDLARHFDVSGPTVREAVRILATMGLVDVRHGSGTYIAENTEEHIGRSLATFLELEDVGIEEILAVRLGLREQIARGSIGRATEKELAAVEAAEAEFDISNVTMLERCESMLKYLASFSSLAHNPLLRMLDNFLNGLVIEFEKVVYSDEPPEFWSEWTDSVRANHIRIIAAIRARDETAAIAAVRDGHAQARRRLMQEPRIARLRMSDPEIIDSLAARL